jgi:hypothetical protein
MSDWIERGLVFPLAMLVAGMLVLLALECMGCGGWQPTPYDDQASACAAACDNMERLKYPGWEGSPGEDEIRGTEDDVACVVVCIDLEQQGLPFHAECLAGAVDRAAMDGCYD